MGGMDRRQGRDGRENSERMREREEKLFVDIVRQAVNRMK